MLPVTGTSSSGVSIVTDPSFELSGHVGSDVLLSAICAELHAPSPFAEGGETRTPSGSVTVTFLRSDWDVGASAEKSCGTEMSNANPDGAPAFAPASGSARRTGVNGTTSQPSIPTGGPQSDGANG